MTARHQLADVIVQVLDPDALDPVQQEVALAVADAVLGMIKPLDWEAEDGNPSCEDAQGTGVFYRVLHRLDDMGLMRINGSRNGETIHVTIEAAKAAANRHHRAQILAALGITQETAE